MGCLSHAGSYKSRRLRFHILDDDKDLQGQERASVQSSDAVYDYSSVQPRGFEGDYDGV